MKITVGAGLPAPMAAKWTCSSRAVRGVRRCVIGELRPAARGQWSQELRGARVVLADAAGGVHDEDAVLHVADHELVDLREVRQVDLALLGDLLAGARVTREPRGEARGGEECGAGEARLHEILRPRVEAPRLEGLLQQHRERRHRRVEVREPPARDEAGRGEAHQQDHAQAAAHAAARVHQHHDGDHVDDDARGHLEHEARLAQARRHQQQHRHDRVGGHRGHDRRGRDDAQVEEAVQEHEGARHEDREHYTVGGEDRQRAPRSVVGLDDQPRARRELALGRDEGIGHRAHAGPQRGLSWQ